jgi:hypothetical protein
MIPHEFRDTRPHENSSAHVANDWIAAISGGRIRNPHFLDGFQHDLAQGNVTHVATQDAVASCKHLAFLNSPNDLRDSFDRENQSSPGTVSGVIREMNSINRINFYPDALQRKHGRAIPYVAIGHAGLNGEDVQRQSKLVHCITYNHSAVAFKMGRRQGGPSRTGVWREHI